MTTLVIAEHDNATIKGATLNTVTAAVACGGLLPAAEPLADGLYAEFTTPRGVFVTELYYRQVPATVAGFVGLAEGTLSPRDGQPFYTGLTWYRVVPGFVIQSGNPGLKDTGDDIIPHRFNDEFAPGLRTTSDAKALICNTLHWIHNSTCWKHSTRNWLRAWSMVNRQCFRSAQRRSSAWQSSWCNCPTAHSAHNSTHHADCKESARWPAVWPVCARTCCARPMPMAWRVTGCTPGPWRRHESGRRSVPAD